MPKKATKSNQTYAVTLANANELDPNALPTNREGKYTDSQRQKLYLALVSKFFSSFLGVVFGLSFLIIVLFVLPKVELLTGWIKIIVLILAFLFGVWWIFEGGKNFFRIWWPLLHDIIGGEIVIQHGKVTKDYADQKYKSMWHRLLDLVLGFISDSGDNYNNDLLSGTYFYLLKDHRFIVSQKGYNELNEDIDYIVYFTQRSKRLINIEPISQ
jgi:hypothetical protein